MRLFSFRRPTDTKYIWLIITIVLISIAVSASFLLYDSPISPLFVAALPLGICAVLVCIRWPTFALYAALLTVLLPLGLFPANIQSILNRLLTVFALISWGVYIIIQRRRIVWTSTAIFMLGFLIWGLLTVLWAQNLSIVINELGGYIFRFVLFLFLFTNEINTSKYLDRLMYTLTIVGWVFILSGISTFLVRGYEVGSRFQILGENENTFGALFPIVAVGVIWLAVRPQNSKGTFWKLHSLIFIILSLVFVALSGSRGGAISWGITILILIFWRKTRFWGIAGLLILIGAVILAPLILSATIDRFIDRTSGTLLGGREALWQAAWLMISDHPMTGVGIGNGPYGMMSYIYSFRNVGEASRVPIHNPILTIFVETGLPGLFLYLGVCISAIGSFIRQYVLCRKFGPEWLMPYFALATSAFIGYFASWIKGGGMETSFSFFLMLALLWIPQNLNSIFANRREFIPSKSEI